MNINVRVKTNHSKQEIIRFGDNRFLVYLTSAPENNEANLELVKVLSKYFGVPPARIKIKFGFSSSDKLVEIG
jgi:uncharacterized protein YggU (UPF0235/DUF167 family)